MTSAPAAALPALSSEYALGSDRVADFRRDGFVRLPGLCSAGEVAAYRAVIADATARLNAEQRAMTERDAFGKAFLQTQQLRLRDDAVSRFVTARRFAKVAADLMGVDGVRIYHDQSLFKEPGGVNPTPWHQDLYYWPFDDVNACGLWVALVDVTDDMGGMRFATGSHTHGFLGNHAISDESQETYQRWIAAHGAEVVRTAPMKAGDASFHYGWTVHAAGPNRSDRMREAMTVAYFADGLRVGAMSNPAKDYDRQVFLGGRAVGALADSELNTLVYHR